MRTPARVRRRRTARLAAVVAGVVAVGCAGIVPAFATGTSTAEFFGAPVALTRLASWWPRSDAGRVGSVTNFQTDDPAYACLNGTTLVVWLSTVDRPDVYFASTYPLPSPCVSGTWTFPRPLSYTGEWSGSTTYLDPAPRQAVEQLPDATLVGTLEDFQTNSDYFACLNGASVDVYTAPAEFPGKLVARSGLGASACAFGVWTFTVPPAATSGISPNGISWSYVAVGTVTSLLAVSFTARGSAPTTVSAVTLGGTHPADFETGNDDCTGRLLPPGTVCMFRVRFTPKGVGTRSAVVSVVSNAPTRTVNVSGRGVDVTVSPNAVAFGMVRVGTTSPDTTVTVSNPTPTRNVTVSAVSVGGAHAGEFAKPADTCTGVTLAPMQSCSFAVRFAPTSTGAKSATVSVVAGEAGTKTVALTGTGTTGFPDIAVAPAAHDFGAANAGTSGASRTVTVSSTGSWPLSIAAVTLGGSYPGDYAVTSDGCSGRTLAVGASCAVAVRFVPAAAGRRDATLTVASDAGSRSVALTGLGDGGPPRSAFTTVDTTLMLPVNVVRGTVTDDASGVVSVTVTYTSENPLSPERVTATLACDAPRTSCTWEARVPLFPGFHRVTVSAVDATGNVESPGPPAITVFVL